MSRRSNRTMKCGSHDVSPPKKAKVDTIFSDDHDDDDENLTYEQLREKRMKENIDMFEVMGVNQAAIALASSLHKVKPLKPIKIVKKITFSKPLYGTTPTRRSMRLANIAPLDTTDDEQNMGKKANDSTDINNDDLNDDTVNQISEEDADFFEKLDKDLVVKDPVNDFHLCNFDRFSEVLKSLSINETPVKVITSRIYSIAVHPSESSLFIAAGDQKGNISLYNQKQDDLREYKVQHGPVNCLSFCSWDSYKLYSTSHDGSVRCGDIVKRTFDTIYTSDLWEEYSKDSHALWHSEYERNLLIGAGCGNVDLIDTRTPMKIQSSSKCHQKSVRTVQSHPLEKHYFLTSSGIGEACLWDVRKMTTTKIDPVLHFEHPKALTSAFFSATGVNMVTTSNDNNLRIFDTSQLTTANKATHIIPHNNHTGRWLSVFKAKWQPGRDDSFFVGSMLMPKRIQVYDFKGKLLHTLISEDYLTTYVPVIEVHPSQAIYVGGNASGRLHIFNTENQLQ
ncbi:WD repeat-containing protein 76-like [Daktulosphaira vitifoliae]|uniref:WD repeat-containing protein 76-like n=1 Tax=Daktulosphaira vitifoliae TaxID=58002 RepID=UPI0021A98BA6|nr:WD repeat-containing protein 76-like [Daktulosphaira vitifoliae]